MSSPDRILIKDLLIRGIVGLNEWEREKRQDILINLTIAFDVRSAGASDDVADTLNYRTVTKDVIAYVEGSKHYLVEALATSIARIVLVDHGAESVVVRVEKVGAVRFAASVGVEIVRSRADFGVQPTE